MLLEDEETDDIEEHHIQTTETKKKDETPLETKEEVTKMSQDRTSGVLVVTDVSKEPLFFEYSGVRFEAKDPKSIALAKALISMKENS